MEAVGESLWEWGVKPRKKQQGNIWDFKKRCDIYMYILSLSFVSN